MTIKFYLIVAAGLALISGFIWYTYYERGVERQIIEAADKKVADAQIIHDEEVTSRVNASLKQAISDYAAKLAAPVLPPPGIVCHAASSRPVSSHAGPPAASDGGAAIPEESTVSFDPAPGILANDRAADAQVTLLQDYIRACQAAGECAR